MEKIILNCLMSLLFFFCGLKSDNNLNNSTLNQTNKLHNVDLNSESDSNSYIQFDISKNPYKSDLISINGTLDKIYNIKCESNDICIITWDLNEQNDVLFEFKINTTKKEFEIELVFSDSSNTICDKTTLFFNNTEVGIFVSQISNSHNIENYESYLLENELITQIEYDEYNSNINNNSVIQTASILDDFTPKLFNFVVGCFNWTDISGNIHPLKNCYVELIKLTGDTLSVINKSYTSDTGSYIFVLNSNTKDSSNNTIIGPTTPIKPIFYFVRIYAKTEHSSVVKSLESNNCYYFDTSLIGLLEFTSNSNFIDRSYTFLNNTDDNSYINEALQITQALFYGEKYAFEMEQTHPDFESVEYPSASIHKQEANHNEKDGIRLGEYTYCYWDVILHEYGHHLQHMLEIVDKKVGGKHTSSKPSEDFNLNWAESWPTVYANLVTKYYANELTGIPYINDDNYDAPNYSNIHWTYSLENLEDNIKYGEYGERDIMYVLFDLFDDTNENFDNISLGHQEFWNIVADSNAENFYEFSKYVLNSTTINSNDFSKLLEEYGMAPTNIKCSPITGLTTPPTIEWSEYKSYGTNKIEISNDWGVIIHTTIHRTYSGQTRKYTISESVWNKILSTYGKQFRIRIFSTSGLNSADFIYSSEYYYFDKPIINVKESFTYEESTRLIEKDFKIYPGSTATFSIRFTTTGKKLFQTLGDLDMQMSIYNETTGTQLGSNDNSGASTNALLNLKLSTAFRFKVKITARNIQLVGDTRLIVSQFDGYSSNFDSQINNFDDIYRINERNFEFELEINQYNSKVLCFVPVSDKQYQIDLTSTFDNYLYLFDYHYGYSNGEDIDYNDDFNGTNAQLTLKLSAGRPYLLFVCAYDASINLRNTNNSCLLSIKCLEN